MRLKRVKIFGFKTFADKVEFDIDGDLIAVVGPNGCGKSNLVDAILWGLGEGNARHLRAQAGVDVIFNGSSKRKPVGYAEVQLYFDNEDGALPVPFNEVVVCRRLTRSGDSQYSINRQPCRLRDVLELLADSGLGRAGYSIVGQKEIDSALAASAEERRAWVDEAAGVQRYRARKIESLRRLATAKDHLSRVNDILNEIDVQREPLREEAEIAKRYKVALSALREVESGLLIVETARAIREVDELEKRISGSTQLLRDESLRADQLESETAEIGRVISQIEIDMDSLRASQQSALTQLERAESNVKLGEQRLASFDELETSLGDEANHAKQRLLEVRSELAAAETESIQEVEAFDRIAAEFTGADSGAKELQRNLQLIDSKLEDARRRHSEHLKIQAETAQRSVRAKEVRRELDSATNSLPSIAEAATKAQTEWIEAKTALDSLESEIAQLAQIAEEIRCAEANESKEHRALLAEQATLEGRKRGIEATIESHEGLSHGAREVLAAAKRQEISGAYLPVGEAIEVDREFAMAIETALGASANDLITETEKEAKQAVEYLKSNHAGRATFQPISLMRPIQTSSDLEEVMVRPDVIGLASRLVRCSNEHLPVIESLLGRIVVVQNLDSALKLARTGGWNRLVTLDGEVVHHTGSVTGGRAQKPGYGLVQRRADLAEIESWLSDLQIKAQSFESASRSRLEESHAIGGQLETLRVELAESTQLESEARKWSLSVGEELSSTERAIHKLQSELAGIEVVQIEPKESVDLASIELERDTALRAFAAKSADAEQAEARIREAKQRRIVAEDRLESSKRRLALALDNESARERKMGSMAPERERVQREIEAAKQAAVAAGLEQESSESRLSQNAELKKNHLERSFLLNEEAKSIRSSIAVANEIAHQAEIARARAESKRANALQRLLEEYGLSEDEAIEMEPSIVLPDDAAQVTGRLRREVRSMGDVNVGSIEAYERLTDRATELSVQKDDIEGGMAEVESSIRELDKLTRDRFLSTFASVQSHFATLFSHLFPGGEGMLRLADGENTLESGIDIDVQLPGKKKQRLELLSGGERSLCATAFLFALLKAKPSPMVVLDEVDAPLDGRNVERFVQLLNDFAGEIQFIIITHNPTTIEAAPVWLGVTMSEPGVSTLVPARIRSQTAPAMLA